MSEPQWLKDARKNGIVRVEGPPADIDDPGDLTATFGVVRAAGFPDPVPEHPFHPRRKWRFDYAWVDYKVALEREGGRFRTVVCKCGVKRTVFVSRHHSRDGLEGDALKYGRAAVSGWCVIRVTPGMISSGVAAELVVGALTARRGS